MKWERLRAWCDEAERGLSGALGPDRDEIAAEVNAGKVELWRINDGKAWLVTCVTRDELIVSCVQGEGLIELGHVLMRLARDNGLRSIRFFTSRPGLARLLRAFSPRPIGTVYCVEVPHE